MNIIISLYLIICNLVLRVVCNPSGYYCTGSNKGNLLLKCTKIPCRDSLCETIVDYVDENGPDVIIDRNRKMLVNFEIKNLSIVHVIFINYVSDSEDSKKTVYRLIKPIVLKVTLDEPGELYKLRFINYINGGPTEEVINKNTRETYFGCDSEKSHSTCGMQHYGLGEPMPFLEGFCCSCLDSVNIARQPRPPRIDSNMHKISTISKSGNNNIQPRGEQECKNLSICPGYANPFTYHESSHCFRYSDLWFNVYKVDKSQTFVSLGLKLFEKNENGVYWPRQEQYMTRSVNGEQTVSKGSASYHYEIIGLNETVENDLMDKFILVPQEVPEIFLRGVPKLFIDEPSKYLAIHPSWMSKNGTECDKIGVQPRAFYEQPERCYQHRGSCLNNQPIDLLRKAGVNGRERRMVQRSERLLVEDYVHGNRIRYDDVTEQIIVDRSNRRTVYDDVHLRGVGEIGLGNNAIVHDRISLQISEIHAIFDSDLETDVAKVRVHVTNLGMKTVNFIIDASDRDTHQENRRKATVHPQQTTVINLPIKCHTKDCGAIVRLYDIADIATVVARRMFGVVRGSRCYCLWHRRCECYRNDSRSGRPYKFSGTVSALTQTENNDAGFRGDVPPGTVAARATALDRDTVSASFKLTVGIVAVAFALGLVKALSPYRSHWLWMVNADWLSQMNAYNEPELVLCQLVRDDRGYYVHPVTGTRNIRLFGTGQEFIMNLIFFVHLPAMLVRYAHARADYSTADCGDSVDTTGSFKLITF